MFSLLAILVCIAELTDLCLTLRAFLPSYLRTLVTTDMNILRREELCNFRKNIFKEGIDLLVAGTENIIRDTPSCPDMVRSTGTSQLRISSKGRKHVTRKVDFRNDFDTFCGSICDDLADLVLSIPHSLTIRDAVSRVEILLDAGSTTL